MSTPTAGQSAPVAAVTIAEFAFEPADLEVPVGATVTWTNRDGVAHSVRTSDGVLRSSDLASGDTYSAALDVAGEMSYYCGIHQYMQGTVTVKP